MTVPLLSCWRKQAGQQDCPSCSLKHCITTFQPSSCWKGDSLEAKYGSDVTDVILSRLRNRTCRQGDSNCRQWVATIKLCSLILQSSDFMMQHPPESITLEEKRLPDVILGKKVRTLPEIADVSATVCGSAVALACDVLHEWVQSNNVHSSFSLLWSWTTAHCRIWN